MDSKSILDRRGLAATDQLRSSTVPCAQCLSLCLFLLSPKKSNTYLLLLLLRAGWRHIGRGYYPAEPASRRARTLGWRRCLKSRSLYKQRRYRLCAEATGAGAGRRESLEYPDNDDARKAKTNIVQVEHNLSSFFFCSESPVDQIGRLWLLASHGKTLLVCAFFLRQVHLFVTTFFNKKKQK